MKNKFIKMFALCSVLVVALMCSVNVTLASAAEDDGEQGELTPIANNVYNDNLFKAVEYNATYKNEKYYYDSNTPEYTNIMEIEEEKDILICAKMKLSYSNITLEWDGATGTPSLKSGGSKMLLFRDDFSLIDESFYWPKFSYFELDASGENVYIYAVAQNQKKGMFTGDAAYFSIKLGFTYCDLNGNKHTDTTSSVTDMYISFVEKDSITKEELSSLEIDYTPKQASINFESSSIDIQSRYLPLNVDEITTINQVASYLKAYNVNGEQLSILTGSIYQEELHTSGNQYDYILKATDSSGEYEILVVTMNIVDKTPPTIMGTSEYTVPNTSLLSVSTIQSTLFVKDNIDTEDDITISIKYDYYTKNYNTPGIYYICFTATDLVGNSRDFVVKINVVDRVSPIFYNVSGTQMNSGDKINIVKSQDSILLLSDFINELKAQDEVDGELKIEVHKDEYTGNGDSFGTYLVVLKATDNAGNTAILNVNISVSEDIPSKTIVIDRKIILVEKSVKLSKDDFYKIIRLIGITPSSITYTSINDEIYALSYNILGEYLVEYESASTNGISNESVFQVRVIESRADGSFVDETSDDGFIMKILKWIWSLLVGLFEWFTSLFK